MNTNELQRRIAIIESKFNSLNIKHLYDSEYNYIIKFGNFERKICFLLNDIDLRYLNDSDKSDALIICLSEDIKNNSLDMVYESNIDFLISIKEMIDEKILMEIIEYVFFKRNNQQFLNIIDDLIKAKNCIVNIKNEKLVQRADNTLEINANIISILNAEFKKDAPFKKRKSKKYFISNDKKTAILAMSSKRYSSTSFKYWFTFHKYQKTFLDQFEKSYVMLYFVDKAACVIIETDKLYSYLDKLNKTIHGDNIGWHLHVQEKDDNYQLRIPKEGTISLKDTNLPENEESIESEVKADNTIKLSLNDYRVVRMKK